MPTQLGPGTITIGDPGDSFEAEVTGVTINHSYDDVEVKAVLADTAKPAARPVEGADTISIDMLADLSSTGYYAYSFTNHLQTKPFTYTPNTADGAKWTGAVRVVKPSEIGADEWGADIEASLELTCTTNLTFTPSGGAGALSTAGDELAGLE